MKSCFPAIFLLIATVAGQVGPSLCGAREVQITILHTTDLHATILPGTDYEGTKDVGGAARCATMIQKIRSERPNVLLVDAGDLYQGNALGYLTEGSVMTRYVNALNYDSWTLGNHEFDWGIDKIAARIKETEVPILAANLHHKPQADTPGEITAAFQKVRPYIMREMDGVKIGVVGLDTPGVPNWSRPRLIPGIMVEDSVTTLKRVLPRMKADGAQILILVTHQGIREQGDDHANQLYAVTQAFPELDVIIGGHTHRLHKEQMIRGILYTQANYWGTWLGRVDLIYDTEQKRLTTKKSDAIPMDATVPMDPKLLKMLKPDLDKAEKFLNGKVGETLVQLDSLTGPKKETPIFNLICAAIAEAVESRGGHVDAVVHGLLNERVALKPGPLTMRDVFEIVPYENTIGVATLTRTQLLEVLEENATAYYSGRFRGLWGLTMKLKPSAPDGKKVLFMGDRQGKSIASQARFRVAFNSFELASGGTRWARLRELADHPESELHEYDFQTRDAVAEYIRKHSPLKIENQGWWSVDRSRKSRDQSAP